MYFVYVLYSLKTPARMTAAVKLWQAWSAL